MPSIEYLPEPELIFKYSQAMTDPRDGLTIFGPLDKAAPHGIRWGVIGTGLTISRMKTWVSRIQKPIFPLDNLVARPFYPGFEAAFHAVLNREPAIEIEIPESKLKDTTRIADRHQRVYKTVDMFASRLVGATKNEDVAPDIWFVVIPEYVYLYCRPKSNIPSQVKLPAEKGMSKKFAQNSFAQGQGLLFAKERELQEQYLYDVDFRHQLKARLLEHRIPTQIIRDIKIAHEEIVNERGIPVYDFKKMDSAIAWNITSATFYKCGGRPWRLGAGREGVCYIGIAFKKDERAKGKSTACCAAQMFLDSGDGIVFKGAVGPWYQGRRGHYHLDVKSAKELVGLCVDTYKEKRGESPKEIFLHGKNAFNDQEWKGFVEGAGTETRIVGVKIQSIGFLKLYRTGSNPIIRGSIYLQDKKRGFLWTKGMVPRLRTYPGREVPNPLMVEICKGEADLKVVMADILALTKLNYNACNAPDGIPVTLRFSDAIGEILTAGPAKKMDVPPLPFKFYI